MKRLIYAIVILSVLALSLSCVTTPVGSDAGAGVGTYSYIRGELKATYSVPLDQAWPATLTALQSLRLHVTNQQVDALGGTIAVQRADGAMITVVLKPIGVRSTTIGVRIGTVKSLWDRDKAERIHHTIKKYVGT